jgi:hypothetical protein
MKLFLKLNILFLVCLLGFIFLVSLSVSSIERKTANFKFKCAPTYLVLGHSHPECAFNDALIPHLKNISKSGESYYYNYSKLKPVMSQNPSVEVVFVEYTNNQINKSMNEWIWGDKFISKSYPLYSSYMGFGDNVVLFKNNPLGYLNNISVSLREKIDRIFDENFDYPSKIGGYLYLERNKTEALIRQGKSLQLANTKSVFDNVELSEVNLSYLDAIIRFCEKNNKEVVLIRSPLHHRYEGYSNENEYSNLLETRYPNNTYLDFSKFPLPNSMYGDLEHLNHKGAKVFSQWFSHLLEDGLLAKENKQDYINRAIKELTYGKEIRPIKKQLN